MTSAPPAKSDPAKASEWTAERSIQHYNLEGWGAGYFTVNEQGHLCVTPYGQPGPAIDIMDVVEDIQERGLSFPCVIRFNDILRSRVVKLNETFRHAISSQGYKGRYFGVYPIKVNQMREVVEEILDAGAPFHYGIEAGSKPELITALALNTDLEALTVCNGYKDEAYMRLALTGRKLGRKTIVVVEKLSELPLLLRVAEEMGVTPMIGVRAKLTTKGAGKWESSSGPFAKFGLTIPEIIQAIRILEDAGKTDCLKLFHFHMGSQLPDIATFKDAVKEGARIYAKLRKMGLPIEYFDVGGGLGVDYVGSNNTSMSSMNYTLEEYAGDVVYNLQQVCESEDVPEPNIVSESGRAVTAHHSCIIMNVFGAIEIGTGKLPTSSKHEHDEAEELGHELVRDMREIVHGVTPRNAAETAHDAQAKIEEALSAFRLGILSLEDRALIENMFWDLQRQLARLMADRKRVPEDLRNIGTRLADQYLANFSVFQSALDSWAFDQVFPLMPVHRLTEAPTRDATVVDITCDSDGKIDQFVDQYGVKPTLSLHTLRPNEPYFLGMFLTGAYQDIMGDMHNLFGRTHELHVFVDDEDPEDYYIETAIPGDIVSDVLSRVQYEPRDLVKKVKAALETKVREGTLKPKEGVSLLEYVEAQMRGYTYLLATSANGLDKLSTSDVQALKNTGSSATGSATSPKGEPQTKEKDAHPPAH